MGRLGTGGALGNSGWVQVVGVEVGGGSPRFSFLLAHGEDGGTDLAAEDRRHIAPGTTSNHDEFYDENGLPI